MNWLNDYPRIRRLILLSAPFLIIITLLMYLASLSLNWKLEWDSAYYLIIAKSIISGHGFTYLGYPCLKIPFGFPILISPVMLLSKSSFLGLNLYMLLFTITGFCMVYLFLRKLFSAPYSFLITFATAWSYLTLTYSGYIMIDIPYMTFSFAALLFILTYIDKPSFKTGALAVLFILISYFLRKIGVVLVGGCFLYLLIHKIDLIKSRRFVILSLLLLAPIGAWSLYTHSIKINTADPVWKLIEFIPSQNEIKRVRFDDPVSTINGPFDIVKRGVKNSVYYAGVSSSLMMGIQINPKKENLQILPLWWLGLLGIISIIIFSGFLHSLIRQRRLPDLYFLLYMGILFAWSAREPRYLLPVLPLLIHYLISGISTIVTLTAGLIPVLKRSVSLIIACCVLVFMGVYISFNSFQNYKIVKNQRSVINYYSPYASDLMTTAGWLKNNVPGDVRVVSVMAPVASMVSDRWCVSFPRIKDPDLLMAYLNQIKSDYLIVCPAWEHEDQYLKLIIDSYPSHFKKLFTRGNATVYEMKHID